MPPYFEKNLRSLFHTNFFEDHNEYSEHSCNYYSRPESHCDEVMEL